MQVCSTIADFGGKNFKKALVKSLIRSEGKDLMDELVYEYISEEQGDREEAESEGDDDHTQDEDIVDTRITSTAAEQEGRDKVNCKKS